MRRTPHRVLTSFAIVALFSWGAPSIFASSVQDGWAKDAAQTSPSSARDLVMSSGTSADPEGEWDPDNKPPPGGFGPGIDPLG
jgi:hypothetical protein